MGKDSVNIKILNWGNYNGRKDVVKASWFRCQNSIPFDPEWHHFDAQEMWVFYYLLSYASFKNREEFSVSVNYVTTRGKISEQKFLSAIEKLEQIQVVSTDGSATLPKRNANVSLRTDGRDGTDERYETDAAELGSHSAPVMIEPNNLTRVFLSKIKPTIQQAWLHTYEDHDWINQEIKKACAWIEANPKRKPRSNYGKFMTDWLSRGWERHRKSLQSNMPGGMLPTHTQRRSENNKRLLERIKRGELE